jgi:hypothetical protein
MHKNTSPRYCGNHLHFSALLLFYFYFCNTNITGNILFWWPCLYTTKLLPFTYEMKDVLLVSASALKVLNPETHLIVKKRCFRYFNNTLPLSVFQCWNHSDWFPVEEIFVIFHTGNNRIVHSWDCSVEYTASRCKCRQSGVCCSHISAINMQKRRWKTLCEGKLFWNVCVVRMHLLLLEYGGSSFLRNVGSFFQN